VLVPLQRANNKGGWPLPLSPGRNHFRSFSQFTKIDKKLEMSAEYGISTYGKEYLVEEATSPSPLRYLYIAINVLLWVGQTAYLSHRFIALRAALRPMARRRQVANAMSLLNFSFIAFTINNVLRSTHMVDHIFRPGIIEQQLFYVLMENLYLCILQCITMSLNGHMPNSG
jgi:hypothetical protein